MPELFPTDFSIESNLAIPVDTFEARYPGGAVFFDRNADTVVTLSPGFYDDVGIAQTTDRLVQGVVSEWQVSKQVTGSADDPKEIVITRLIGYDRAKRLGDTYFRKRYLRPLTGSPLSSQPLVSSAPELGAIPEVRGTFTYQQVAAEACAAAGLSLAWSLPNPEIQKDYTASGRVLDILAGFARPWTLAEPYRADIYVSGTTVIVRQRSAVPSGPTVISAAQLRAKSVRLIARPPKPFGVIVIRGRTQVQTVIGPGGTGGGGGVIVVGGLFDVREDSETVKAEYTYRDGLPPFGLLLTADKRTFQTTPNGVTQIQRERIENDWQASVFDGGQRINTPQQLSGITRIEGFDDDKVWKELRTEAKSFSYTADGYLSEERTLVKRLNFDSGVSQMRDFELHVRTLAGDGPLLTSDTSDVYVPDGDAGFFGDKANAWKLKPGGRNSGTSGGHRPGGPGRGRGRRSSGSGSGSGSGSSVGTQVVVASGGTSPGARGIDATFGDLDQGQCQQIHDQLRASGGMWEYEVEIVAPTIPWIGRGIAIQLTGVTADDGTPIPSSPMTVYELSIKHDESSERPSSMMTVRAGWWA